ncbi:transcription termination/antitermination protein NusG, partial [Candidatus Microgenomates bacterium]|nr:transcription termination/antitermination protein NusG [Candidatus Microgenomates bacterium]
MSDKKQEKKEEAVDNKPEEVKTAVAESAKPATDEQPQVADKGQWFVVHTYSGHENKAAAALKQRITAMNLGGKIYEIVVP